MSKYKLYIRQYDITTNDYKVREEEVETNDIYHTIGEIYCTSITEIKRIDYQKIDKEKELQQRVDAAIKYIKANSWSKGVNNEITYVLNGQVLLEILGEEDAIN